LSEKITVVNTKDRDQQPYFSNCATDPDNGFFLTKAEILAVIKFDLANIFFVSRGLLFRQIEGIAMGSPNSPAVAILGCASTASICSKISYLPIMRSLLHGRPFVLCPRFSETSPQCNARSIPVDPALNSTQYSMTCFTSTTLKSNGN
jgi:hypothetical protein